MQTYVFTVAVTAPDDMSSELQDYVEGMRNRLIEDDGHDESIDVMVTDGVRVA